MYKQGQFQHHQKIIDTIDNLKEQVNKLATENAEPTEYVKLSDFHKIIENYCTNSGIKKADICVLAGISTTTLTQTLKNPLKASISTINALSSVIGYQIYIGRT